jgi:hypothetical protein
VWTLTFMDGGRKRVERIPIEWVKNVREMVKEGRRIKTALARLLIANAERLIQRRNRTKSGGAHRTRSRRNG